MKTTKSFLSILALCFIQLLVVKAQAQPTKCKPPYAPYKSSFVYMEKDTKGKSKTKVKGEKGKIQFVDSTQSKTTLVFEAGLNDSLSIFLNNQYITKDFFKSDDFTGNTGLKVDVDYTGRIRGSNIFLSTPSGADCVKIEVKKGFAYMEISRDEQKNWIVVYSNNPAF